MSLSIILDIVIGLTFVYLILSLLVSEIQEILSSLLQWRAEHLKQAIEVLLSGNDKTYFADAEKFANELYKHPLIQDLNQTAKGRLTSALRGIIRWLGQAYRLISQTRNTFGEKRSGPSYIPSDKFAAALLTGLNVEHLGQLLARIRLAQLGDGYIMEPIHQILADLKASLANESLLDIEVKQLEQGVVQVMEDFQAGQVPAQKTLERLLEQMDLFIATAEAALSEDNPLRDTFFRRLTYLKQSLNLELPVLTSRLEPTITETISLLDRKSGAYREVVSRLRQDDQLYDEVIRQFDDRNLPPRVRASYRP